MINVTVGNTITLYWKPLIQIKRKLNVYKKYYLFNLFVSFGLARSLVRIHILKLDKQVWIPALCACMLSYFSPTLCDAMDCIPQASLSIRISRQEYWSWLPCPSPGDISDSGIEPRSPAFQPDSLPSKPPGKPNHSSTPYYMILGKSVRLS